MSTTYGYRPGPENICRVCNGFLRWPDGLRIMCHCEKPVACQRDPGHSYWEQKPYRTWEQEKNDAEGWPNGNALAN